jgi:glycosyltransferase involved in cell wall biosynthesis
MTNDAKLSAIIPVTERFDDVEEVYREYKAGAEATKRQYEFIYVLDGQYPDVQRALESLIARGEPIKIVALAKWFGEATAIGAGHASATGGIIVTLPAYLQAKGEEIPRIVAALEGCDMVVARRFPRRDSAINVFQSSIFHSLLKALMEQPFHDLGCGVRAMRRQVLDEVGLYGEQHRLLPILTIRQGFRVNLARKKIVSMSSNRRTYTPGR